jgi:hypothetical protein
MVESRRVLASYQGTPQSIKVTNASSGPGLVHGHARLVHLVLGVAEQTFRILYGCSKLTHAANDLHARPAPFFAPFKRTQPALLCWQVV